MKLSSRIILSCLLSAAAASPGAVKYVVDATPGDDAGEPDRGFVSYSFELAFFPDYAGNDTNPNSFSSNLIANIGALSGTTTNVRVGGNTQDYSLYDPALDVAIDRTYGANDEDFPTSIMLGPSFFESYNQWDKIKFTHGFNMNIGGNNSAGWQTLLDSVPVACKTIGSDRIDAWEYGNEADMYGETLPGYKIASRPEGWGEEEYVRDWLNATRQIESLIEEHCPEMATPELYGFFAPSFADNDFPMTSPKVWAAGLNEDGNIKFYARHGYMATSIFPGITMQGTLMNHTNIVAAISKHLADHKTISASGDAPPVILGETNSLSVQGLAGVSNAFGAALWSLDYQLLAASTGFKRVHMHQGVDYRYASWQPIGTNRTTLGTKPPYYGQVATAAFLGSEAVKVSQVPLSGGEREAAYAAYENGRLARAMVINLNTNNTTSNGDGFEPLESPPERPSVDYTFSLPGVNAQSVGLHRLWANGSDALTGVTWDGWSYNYELDDGRPVRLENVTVGETAEVRDGEVTVTVPHSSAVMLSFGGEEEPPRHTSGASRRLNILGFRL